MPTAGLIDRPDAALSSRGPAASSNWRMPLVALALATIAWAVLFRVEIVHAVSIWESSAAYNHSWLILPIALWLAWGRRHRLEILEPAPVPAFALLALPAGLAWLLAERMGIMEGRQFAALGLFYAIVLAVLGWRIALAMAAPLAYLIFLVPFGAFTVPLLQTLTARMVDVGLDWTSIPHYVDDLLIEIPEGRFYVAEACAGLRFIIAALAFGALYALVMFRSPWRRALVMVLALVVPVIANGIRAFGLVVLGHLEGSAAAVEADHVIYGWGFFSLVILLLILAGLPFRQDHATPPLLSDAGRPGRPPLALPAAAVAILLAGIGPALSAWLDDGAAATAPRELRVELVPMPGCELLPDGAMDCQGIRVAARLLLFSPRVNWDTVSSARRALTLAVSDQDVTFDMPMNEGGAFRARQPHGQPGTTAVAAWLDGRIVGDGVRTRATQAIHAVRGGHAGGPVLMVLELHPTTGGADGQRERAVLRAMLDAQGSALGSRAVALSLQR